MTTLQYEDSGYREKQIQKQKDEFAIGFAEWIRIKDFQTTHKNTWIGVDMEHYLTKELLEIYKKEKL